MGLLIKITEDAKRLDVRFTIPKNMVYFTLEEMKELLEFDELGFYGGGATHPAYGHMICHDNGLALGLQLNFLASELYLGHHWSPDGKKHPPIVGDVLFCRKGEII